MVFDATNCDMGSPGFMSMRVKKSCLLRLLLISALVQASRGDLFSWIFGEDDKVQSQVVVSKPTASNLKDSQPFAGDDELVDPPFEVVNGEVFTSISKNDDFLKMLQESAPESLSELDLCQHEVSSCYISKFMVIPLKFRCSDFAMPVLAGDFTVEGIMPRSVRGRDLKIECSALKLPISN